MDETNTKMSFSQFARILYPVLSGGMKVSEFTKQLFYQITCFGEDEDNPIDNLQLQTFKKYYSGDNNISRIALAINGHVDTYLFDEFLSSFPETVLDNLNEALESALGRHIKPSETIELCTTIFKNIIEEGAGAKEEAGAPKSKSTGRKKTKDDLTLSFELANTIVPFADEHTVLHREDTIGEIVSLLCEGKKLLLYGFGGIGKTALARVVYHQVSNRFEHVAWIDYHGDLKNSILSSFELYSEVTDSDLRWEMLSRLLKNDTHNKLFIIDDVVSNAEIDQDPLSDNTLLEISGWQNLSVLLTSRLRELPGYPLAIALDYLSSKDCIDLFYHYHAPRELKKPAEERFQYAAARQLVEKASRHSYAVELLAKGAIYEESLEVYLQKIKEKGFQFPELRFRTDHSNVEAKASEQLRILFNIQTRSKCEQRVLWDFSVLPQIALSKNEVKTWLDYDENDLDKLVREGWLSFCGGFYMHPLMKETLHLDFIGNKAPVGTSGKLIGLLNRELFFDPDEPHNTNARKILVIESVLTYVSVPNKEEEAKDHFIVANACRRSGNISSAIRHYRKSLALYEQLIGAQTSETAEVIDLNDHLASVLNELGYQLSYTSSGRSEAIALIKRALSIRKRLTETEVSTALLEKFKSDYATTCDYYGYLLSDHDEEYKSIFPCESPLLDHPLEWYWEAEYYLRKGLAIRKELMRGDPEKYYPLVAWSQDNLGFLLSKAEGRNQEAESLLREALEARRTLERNNPGRYTSEIAWTCNNLAILLSLQNRNEDAEKLFREALKIRKVQESNFHLKYAANLASACNNLANIIRLKKESQGEAGRLYAQALAINKELNAIQPHLYLGEIALILNNYASLLGPDKRSDAVRYFQHALGLNAHLICDDQAINYKYYIASADIMFNCALREMKTGNREGDAREFLQEAIKYWTVFCSDSKFVNTALDLLTQIERMDTHGQTFDSYSICYFLSGSREIRYQHFEALNKN